MRGSHGATKQHNQPGGCNARAESVVYVSGRSWHPAMGTTGSNNRPDHREFELQVAGDGVCDADCVAT